MSRRLIRVSLIVVVSVVWVLLSWAQAGVFAASAPPLPPAAAPPVFSAEEIAVFYSYDDMAPLKAASTPLDSTAWYDQYEVEYQSLGETVYARLMLPKADAPVPCMVGVHGMFSDTVYQFWTAADFCAKRGIAVICPSLPYHHKRTEGFPLIPGQQLIAAPPDEVTQNLRRAVVDIRRALDYVSGLPRIDASEVSVGGASLGGTLAALALKVDLRFTKGVAVVGGSGTGGIIEEGDIPVLDAFRLAARLGLVDTERYIDALRIVDPITVPDIAPRPALLMSGLTDTIMVTANAVKLRESLALAEQVWTTGGHYFPMFAAQYMLVDYLLNHAPARVEIGGGLGFAFTERVGKPQIGADNLWISLDVETVGGIGDIGGTAATTMSHRMSVPLVNRDLPMVVLSEASYEALEGVLADRHFPAFVYITKRDSALELDAALAYVQILGVGADPLVYYIAPQQTQGGQGQAGQTQYSVGTLSRMTVSRARNTIESLLKVPGGSAASAARVPAPLSVFDRMSLVDGSAGLEAWMTGRLSVERLGPILWLPDYPCDNPRWAVGP